MIETSPPILIASNRLLDAAAITRVLSEEFTGVQLSSDPALSVKDWTRCKPAVLILAFGTLQAAEQYYRSLCQPGPLAQALPYRVLLLCSQEEMREAYEACKKGLFDDFVMFWPRTEETRPLRMAVRRALQQAVAAREGTPSVADFAAQARRLAALEPLLEEHVQKQAGAAMPEDSLVPVLDAVRALRGLAERCRPLVLVVDDDRFQHKVLGQLLAVLDVELAYAMSVTEALASLQRRRADLVLMDVNLPDIDGVAATRLLKGASHFAAIPVIMITGVGGKTMVVDSLKAGATDFVVKPFDKTILVAKVRRVLNGQVGQAAP